MNGATQIETAADVVTEKTTARFVNEDGRSSLVPLEYPVEFDGMLWTEVEVRRVTGGEMEAYMKAVVSGENVLPPVIDCPMAVWDAMDADDQLAIDEVAQAFMPKRLKTLMASPAAPAASGKEG